MKKKECCLCLEASPLTREHRIKRSLLEYFNNIQNTSEDKVLKFNNGTDTGGEFSNIKIARALRPKKNICAKCNSERSADCDPCFDKFVIEAFHSQEYFPEVKSIISPSIEDTLKESENQRKNIINFIDHNLWTDYLLFVNSKYLLTTKYQIHNRTHDNRLIKKYLAKHSICYFDRVGISPPAKLRDIFMESKNLDTLDFNVYFLPLDFQHGYLNTMIKMPEKELSYALIFSNLAIQVIVKK
jgi:hypothetical protein